MLNNHKYAQHQDHPLDERQVHLYNRLTGQAGQILLDIHDAVRGLKLQLVLPLRGDTLLGASFHHSQLAGDIIFVRLHSDQDPHGTDDAALVPRGYESLRMFV